jgi:hypothetical protein
MYLVAPILGGITASLVYQILLKAPKATKPDDYTPVPLNEKLVHTNNSFLLGQCCR